MYYSTYIKYSDVFGVKYIGTAHPSPCNSTNTVLRLSNSTNAHAGSSASSYTTPICYGDLTAANCQIITSGDCEDISGGKHKCVVTLSSTTAPHYTNSHLATCTGASPYSTKICCKSPQTTPSSFCELMEIKEGPYESCWNNSRGAICTWTPVVNATTGNLTTSNDDGGHCCGEDMKWDPNALPTPRCVETGGTCNDPWAVDNQDEPARKSSGTGYYNEYCARIAPGAGSIGLYLNVEAY